MLFQSINPASGEILESYDTLSDTELDRRLNQVQTAYQSYKTTTFAYRAERMKKAGQILLANKEKYARIMTREMGKPIKQATAEIEKCALVCDYYAENAERQLASRSVDTENYKSFVRYDPMGPVFAIMPWNFPFWQVFRFAAPTLMAGNGGILKHAPNVPASALAIEEIFLEAGFPEHIFSNLFIDIDQSAQLIADRRISGVTLTGSEMAGRAVASRAGESLKKSVLELGGSDPFIVLESADLEKATSIAVTSRTQNSGQSCIAAKRFVVMNDIADEFTELFHKKMSSLKSGDPMDESTDIGPIARDDLRSSLHEQVDTAIKQGAEARLGGEIPEGPGFFYPVTLLTNVKFEMKTAKEETFGPVASIIRVNSHEEAIRIANHTNYGLGASLWTGDLELAESLAPRIEAGSVFVNTMVKSDVRLPFGGIKDSGYGRELGDEGIREFMNAKTVVMVK